MVLLAGMLVVAGGANAGNPSATLDQCANGTLAAPSGCNPADWVNGNLGSSKAHYLEGDSVPYRMTFANLATGATPIHHLTIEWDTTKSGKHALDYLTTWNRTVTTANPCAGVTGCTLLSPSSTIGIPSDPQVVATGTGAAGGQIAGDFTLWGGTFTTITSTANAGYTYANGAGFAGDKSARIELNFTASVANPVIAWGGHIATRIDWGTGLSAVAIPGSPFHMRLVALDGAGGNQDRSLSNDAVTFPASITIIKDVAGGTDPQDFAFTTTGGLSPSGFSLDDDANATLSNTQAFSGLTNFATYTFTEGVVSNWAVSFQTPVCTVTSPNTGTQSGVVSTRTLTINLHEGENVTCTFVNTHNSTQSVTTTQVKKTVGDGNVADGGSIAIGESIYDTNNVTGSSPAGTVTYWYQLQTANDQTPNCTSGTKIGADKSVGVASDGKSFTAAGTYELWAVYVGDSNNIGSSSICGDETVVVSPNIPTIQTSPTLQVRDAVTIGNLAAVATFGNLTVKLVNGSDCNGTTLFTKIWYGHDKPTGEDAFTGNATYTTAFVAVGADATLRWCSAYEGDANNAARPFADDNEVIAIDFFPLGSAAAFGMAIPMLLWGLWNRKRRNAGE
jgi:hypothetical protein